MAERMKGLLASLKEFWDNISKPKKLLIVGTIVGLILVSAVAAVMINKQNSSYTVLFPGMNQQESVQVFAALQSRNLPVRRSATGEVEVPAEKLGDAMLEMSVLGYPKTTMSFDIFSSNAGFTTTEMEKKEYLVFNLQDRIEKTIGMMSGVKSVVVTLNVPKDNSYVWNETTAISTASVSVSMLPGFTLTPEQVAGLKSMVASGVPQLAVDNVTIIDSDTMQEMQSKKPEDKYGLDRLGFEAEVEKKMEEKIRKQLLVGYPPGDVMVSVTALIDYDKMITENMQYVPESNGSGVRGQVNERYTNEGSQLAEGVPGENENTDIPLYENQTEEATGYVDYQRDIDYLVSHIKKQIEKDYAQLKSATAAITVRDNEMTEEKQRALIETASKAANIPIENISLNNFVIPDVPDLPAVTPSFLTNPIFWVGAGFLLLFVIVAIFLILRRGKKKEEPVVATEDIDGLAITEGERRMLDPSAQQKELDAYRNKLRDQVDMDSKEAIAANEMREFAKANPEITAAMLRSWLREDE